MTYQFHRGGQARTVNKVEARRKAERAAHNVVMLTQGDRTVPEVAQVIASVTDHWTDLRRSRLFVYGALLRFIDFAIALGTPRAVLLLIPGIIATYINDQFPDPAAPGRLTLHTTGEYPTDMAA